MPGCPECTRLLPRPITLAEAQQQPAALGVVALQLLATADQLG
jgi:hypothetical protein